MLIRAPIAIGVGSPDSYRDKRGSLLNTTYICKWYFFLRLSYLINMNCVYILHSIKLNRFYIGFTSDFEIRMEFHKNAESNKFTSNAKTGSYFSKYRVKTKLKL